MPMSKKIICMIETEQCVSNLQSAVNPAGETEFCGIEKHFQVFPRQVLWLRLHKKPDFTELWGVWYPHLLLFLLKVSPSTTKNGKHLGLEGDKIELNCPGVFAQPENPACVILVSVEYKTEQGKSPPACSQVNVFTTRFKCHYSVILLTETPDGKMWFCIAIEDHPRPAQARSRCLLHIASYVIQC